jgi:hypothetical protein
LFTIQRKLILTIEVLFVFTTGLIKCSILLFFRRLGARGVSKTFRIVTWIAIGFQVGSTIAFFISPFIGCRPLSAYWEQSDVLQILQGTKFNCNDEGAAITAAGVVSTVQDVITAFLPNFIYWKAQIPFRQKVALMAIFATAYLAAAFGALRTYATWFLFYRTYDVSWQLWEIWNYTLLEFHIGIICANAPALKAFVKQYLDIKSVISNRGGNSSRAKSSKSSQAQSSQTGSKASSNPSGKSKMSKWKDPFAHHGYYSQAMQMSQDEQSGIHIIEEVEENTSDTERSSGYSNWSQRQQATDDVELGLVPNTIPFPSQPPEAHRGSIGLTSLYFYDETPGDDSTGGGLRYLRVRI